MKIRRMNQDVLEICDEDERVIIAFAEQVVEGQFVITLLGELRNEVSHEFEDEVMAALSVCSTVVIDFQGVTYIASGALKTLLAIQQMIDDTARQMILVNVTGTVAEEMTNAGFFEILQIENK